MKLWNKISQDLRLIKTLIGINLFQLVIIIGLFIAIFTIPTRFTFHIPPDLSNGATLHANKIPNSYVGQFTFNIWQILNDWSKDGSKDAENNLRLYSAYLTPSFRYQLNRSYKALKSRGELQGRVRVIQPMVSQPPIVKKISSGKWQVILKARETEYVNGVLIKNKEIEFPFEVVKYNENEQLNPFGLAINGFTSQPFVIKTYK